MVGALSSFDPVNLFHKKATPSCPGWVGGDQLSLSLSAFPSPLSGREQERGEHAGVSFEMRPRSPMG